MFPHVLVADALGESIHGIARVYGMGKPNPQAIVSELGMSPGRAKRVQAQAIGWDAPSIARAMSVVATLNGDVKGQAADADFSLQRAVAAIADLRPSPRR